MEVVYFINSYERTNVMLDRYALDELSPMERIDTLLESRFYIRKSDLNFLVDEVSSHEERKLLAQRILERTDIRLSKGARKLLDDILAQE